MIKNPMSDAELRALDTTVDMETAGRAFRMGRTKAYQLARNKKFPCEVLPLGHRFVVTKAALLRALGREDLLHADIKPADAA
jgi:hypothetical protein